MTHKYMLFPRGKEKAVTFSYDDGSIRDIRLSDTLTSYGLKGTFNLTGDALWHGNGLSAQDVKEHILSKGHEVAIHGYNHRAEGILRPIEGIRDVLDCRTELERKYNIIIRGMAYPNSGIRFLAHNNSFDTIKNYLKELDIAYARTLGEDNNSFDIPNDWYKWMPTAHHENPEVMKYIDEFLAIDLSEIYLGSRRPKLFYLWGHSYEFERNGNWELLDEICKKLSGRSEVWYATNIEIYNYTEAYNSLVYSADSTIIYNPTLLDVWINIDEKTFLIHSGETIHID